MYHKDSPRKCTYLQVPQHPQILAEILKPNLARTMAMVTATEAVKQKQGLLLAAYSREYGCTVPLGQNFGGTGDSRFCPPLLQSSCPP